MASRRTPTIGRSVSRTRLRSRTGRYAPMAASATARRARHAPPPARRVVGRPRTTASSAGTETTSSTGRACPRTAMASAKGLPGWSRTTTRRSATVSSVRLSTCSMLIRWSQVAQQSALRAAFLTSTSRRQSTKCSALDACLVLSFRRANASRAAPLGLSSRRRTT